jgi:hypothetical protein
VAPTGNAFPITAPTARTENWAAPLIKCSNYDIPSTPWNPYIVYTYGRPVDDSSEVLKLKNEIKFLKRERDLWRNRALSKKR